MRRHDEDAVIDGSLGDGEHDESLTPRDLVPPKKRKVPVSAYVILAAAVLAVSSAGVVFKQLERDVRPVTIAAWRLQATTAVLVPLFVWQWRSATPELRHDWLQAWHIMSASGICLAVHFGVWVVGLNYTTLPHALLFVTCTPILIAFGCLISRIPISRAEIASVAIGFGGMLLCEISTNGSKGNATLLGDMLSLAGAVMIIGYLQAGHILRAWMPIFLYALPVTGVAAVLLTIVSVVLEGAAINKLGAEGVFGYFESRHIWLVLYLAIGPGLVGHTGFNALLRFFPPLVITMAVPLESIIGSMLGWVFGVSEIPGVWTWVGGLIMVGALVACTYAQGRHKASMEKKRAVNEAMQDALGDNSLVELSNTFAIVDSSDDDDLDIEEG
eukprot:jgi/Ulvmu1/12165/UM085_0029.1